MSLINKERIKKEKERLSLLQFFPDGYNYSNLFLNMNNYINRWYGIKNIDDERLMFLLKNINVYNLFEWRKTSEDYDFWKNIDNEQYKFINIEKEHFFVDYEWEKLTFDLDENDGFSTYNINSEIIKQILYKFSKK